MPPGDPPPAPVTVIHAGPDQDSVVMLEGLLERARAGDFMCVAFAALTRQAQVTTGWSPPPRGRHLTLVGAVDYLKWRMHAHMDKE